jgi:AraC-like DNA-binding protein
MTQADWHGDLWLAEDFALIFGKAGVTSEHAHYAHQVLLSAASPITASVEGVVVTDRCVLIPSMQRHAVLDAPESLFTVYVEPLVMSGDTLRAQLVQAHPSLPALAQAVRERRTPVALDSRVARALASVDALLAGKVSAKSLADSVHVSLSQLERLLGSQVGLPLRRLVLWRRLRLAVGLVFEGQTLTSAAHGAGFSDSAHFSRTMRFTFGVRADRSLRHMVVRHLG